MSDEDNNDCNDLKEKVKCKYFHQDPDMTPNNYDLFFDYNSIPVNIRLEQKNDLIRELKKHMSLTKRIHLNMETETIPHNNQLNLYTMTRIILTKEENNTNEDKVINIR